MIDKYPFVNGLWACLNGCLMDNQNNRKKHFIV